MPDDNPVDPDPNKTVVLGRYRHWKGGVYQVVGFATCAQANHRIVIYRKVGDREDQLWTRPAHHWFQLMGGDCVSRFTFIHPEREER